MQWSFLIFSVFTYGEKYVNIFKQRAVGSAGRAPALQAGGQEFESPTVHKKQVNFSLVFSFKIF